MSADPMSLNQGVQLATGITSAVVTIFNAIVRDLDAAGVVAKDRLADQLEREVLRVQEARAPELGTTDLVIFRRLAKALRDPNAPSVGVWDAAKWGE